VWSWGCRLSFLPLLSVCRPQHNLGHRYIDLFRVTPNELATVLSQSTVAYGGGYGAGALGAAGLGLSPALLSGGTDGAAMAQVALAQLQQQQQLQQLHALYGMSPQALQQQQQFQQLLNADPQAALQRLMLMQSMQQPKK
jgi:hypothetical protein